MSKIVLALDVGERRIGVALASSIACLASPHSFIDRQQTPDVAAKVKEIIGQQDVEAVVVGLPRGMDGQDTLQAEITRQFAAELEQSLQLPIVMQDETGTSLLAEERLRQRGKPYGKGDIDAEAAALILHDYLSQREANIA